MSSDQPHFSQPHQQGPGPHHNPGPPSQQYGPTPQYGLPTPPPPPRKGWFARHKIITALMIIFGLIVISSMINSTDGESAEPGVSASGEVAAPAPAEAEPNTSEDKGEDKSEDRSDADEPAEKEQPAEKPAGLGDPVRAGDFEVTATKINCDHSRVGSEYWGEDAQGKYCIVKVSVTNVGNDPQYLSDDYFSLYDAKGRQFDVDTEAMISNDDSSDLWLEDINPGNSVKGEVIFDIPKKANPTTLEFSGSWLDQPAEIAVG